MPIKVSKFLLSSLLTWILMLPYWGSFSHIFEGHDHKTCDISETHVHEIDLDCDILDYHFSPRTNFSQDFGSVVVLKISKKKSTSYDLGYCFLIDTLSTLRGPPPS